MLQLLMFFQNWKEIQEKVIPDEKVKSTEGTPILIGQVRRIEMDKGKDKIKTFNSFKDNCNTIDLFDSNGNTKPVKGH
mgnify:CR=1 FL=1